jgi:hypothetical protein
MSSNSQSFGTPIIATTYAIHSFTRASFSGDSTMIKRSPSWPFRGSAVSMIPSIVFTAPAM